MKWTFNARRQYLKERELWFKNWEYLFNKQRKKYESS